MKIAQLILISAVLFMTGCSASGPAFSRIEKSEPNKALVYVYVRDKALEWPIIDIYIDEVCRGRLLNNGYQVYSVDPGKRILTAKERTLSALTVYPDIVEGHEYYFRWSYNSHGLVVRECRLEAIPSEIAIEEIKHTKRSD